jgi:large subunit ribosomal protein L24
MKIKANDTVIVIAGKDKGQIARVMKLLPKNRALVEGVNMVKKHQRPNPNKNEQGGIIDQESGINVTNLAIYNSVTKKADRVGYKVLEDGRKVRYFKSNDEVIDI